MVRDGVMKIAQKARNDGLTLAWATRYLTDKLLASEDGDTSLLFAYDATSRRVERRALALVLHAVQRAYSDGETIREPDGA